MTWLAIFFYDLGFTFVKIKNNAAKKSLIKTSLEKSQRKRKEKKTRACITVRRVYYNINMLTWAIHFLF